MIATEELRVNNVNQNMESGRKLSEKELKRAEIIKEKVQSFLDKGYEMTNLTVSTAQSYIMAFLTSLPLLAIFVFGWYVRNDFSFAETGNPGRSVIFWGAFVASIVIHELIHGFFWGLFADGHFKSIEFGFSKESFTPYCTCLTPLSKTAYLLGAIAPAVILGFVPCIAAIVTGNFNLLFFGCISLLGAGGDFTVVLKLLGYRSSKNSQFCMDHPTKVGLMMLEK